MRRIRLKKNHISVSLGRIRENKSGYLFERRTYVSQPYQQMTIEART